MINDQIDLYAMRIASVKDALTLAGWTQVRGDEWRLGNGSSLRFSYAHKEWRIHKKYAGQDSCWYSVRVDDVAPPPTIAWVLHTLLEIQVAVSSGQLP